MENSKIKEEIESIKVDNHKGKWSQEMFLKQLETITASKLSNHVVSRLSYQEIIDLKLVFDAFDIDEDRSLECHEMQRALRVLGYRLKLNAVQGKFCVLI
ncbi:hypothetical protein TrispH2_011208 [Trichoplax sp. H2]|nr:hypothetical protein TrispH2_011208 [Trichoplax sp. H2]|eukprot:RDD36991.1 hypothetical protein TrispH2_011208 [Trichoplax sp. H2]